MIARSCMALNQRGDCSASFTARLAPEAKRRAGPRALSPYEPVELPRSATRGRLPPTQSRVADRMPGFARLLPSAATDRFVPLREAHPAHIAQAPGDVATHEIGRLVKRGALWRLTDRSRRSGDPARRRRRIGPAAHPRRLRRCGPRHHHRIVFDASRPFWVRHRTRASLDRAPAQGVDGVLVCHWGGGDRIGMRRAFRVPGCSCAGCACCHGSRDRWGVDATPRRLWDRPVMRFFRRSMSFGVIQSAVLIGTRGGNHLSLSPPPLPGSGPWALGGAAGRARRGDVCPVSSCRHARLSFVRVLPEPTCGLFRGSALSVQRGNGFLPFCSRWSPGFSSEHSSDLEELGIWNLSRRIVMVPLSVLADCRWGR